MTRFDAYLTVIDYACEFLEFCLALSLRLGHRGRNRLLVFCGLIVICHFVEGLSVVVKWSNDNRKRVEVHAKKSLFHPGLGHLMAQPHAHGGAVGPLSSSGTSIRRVDTSKQEETRVN